MTGKMLPLFIILSYLQLGSEAGSCYKYIQGSRRTCSGWWWGHGCKTNYYHQKVCCHNYNGNACSNPKCKNGYGAHTCNVNNEGYVKYKSGNVVRNSGGECYAPFKCRNCNKGYYPVSSNGGYCQR
ncbi:uncharacterized protein LOC132730722 [Ruditapes philippinarum]|uniref:uncharacterized protein LOC132730722 n=1 Tax=Ruditapes philippinarum TaxID=129788 RepID=UPI00295BDD17|nr:uncharacterized protein LOC132730722 [Ruditapes philippinarum]